MSESVRKERGSEEHHKDITDIHISQAFFCFIFMFVAFIGVVEG